MRRVVLRDVTDPETSPGTREHRDRAAPHADVGDGVGEVEGGREAPVGERQEVLS